MISNRWKILAAALPIIGTLALAQPQPGGLGGFFQAWWGSTRIPFLQNFPNALVAYSLRELSADYANQDLIVARRSGDNAEEGFTELEIKNGTLESWAGTNSAFVKTWYDQSGNDYHMIQTNTANQAKIVNNGALITSGGFPAVQGDGSDDFMAINVTLASSGDLPFTRLVVREVITSSSIERSAFSVGGQVAGIDRRNIHSGYDNASTLSIRLQGGNAIYSHTHSGLELFTSIYSGGGGLIPSWINSQSLSVSSFSNAGLNIQTNSYVDLFRGGFSRSACTDAKLCEAIIYFTDYLSSRTEIEDEINSYYSLF